MIAERELNKLAESIKGELHFDDKSLTIYATDASAYKEKPIAVALPYDETDIQSIIRFANDHSCTLIPRTAGTSLAGQVVGNGIVVDVSKYFNKIIELNKEEKWVRVQPGVVLDELNLFLKGHGLYFGPETSTSNRCMIGGMVGNNSCGAHALVYGSTRDHTLEVKGYLSDASFAEFKELCHAEYENKLNKEGLEGDIYRELHNILSDAPNRERITKEFPDPEIIRRNTGYALDILMKCKPFDPNGDKINLSKILCGSEGTLMFTTEIKLNLVESPPPEKALLVVHHESLSEALEANITVLKHRPYAIELFDKYILDCTKSSREHRKNRFFIEGSPKALLCVEFTASTRKQAKEAADILITDLKDKGYGYSFPTLYGKDILKVWALRKAGLGMLSNVPGDAKPQPVIEDTAINPSKLPLFIREFDMELKNLGLNCVYYAHIDTGELHLRPVINLKEKEGVVKFRNVATSIAHLVKKYKGSLSGEHGDGRLRGEFIPLMVGEENFLLLKRVKTVWDPEGIFNKGKIIDTPPMDSFLRYVPDNIINNEIDTKLDFQESLGFQRMAENCNGTGDCRKSEIIGGTMCPSYQATRDEDKTTRARANILREVMNNNPKPFSSKEVYEILDLCLSCKGCKTECPSGVDMAKLKAEFLFQYYKSKSPSIRTRLIAYYPLIQSLAAALPKAYNYFMAHKVLSKRLKQAVGFAKDRSLPKLHKHTFRKWLNKNLKAFNGQIEKEKGALYLFVDEFTNYNDVELGITTVKLLNALDYRIMTLDNRESGRSFISKGGLL